MSKFYIWIDNPSSQVESITQFENSEERMTGFMPRTKISSKSMNTILRQVSLVSVALLKALNISDNVSFLSSIDDVKNEILASFTNLLNANVDNTLSLTSEKAVQNKVITAELNKKLDKQYPSGQSVYTGTADGTTQMMLIGTNNPAPNTIPRRTSGGQIFTETATEPKHSVPLEQMQEELAKKLDQVSTTLASVDRVYIIKPDGTQSTKQATKWYPTIDAIMMRDEKGYAKAFTPLNETPDKYHLINYEYFAAKAMTKRYRHIIRMSTDYTTTVDNTERTYNEVVFAIESSRNTKYTFENDLEELIAELEKYGVDGGLLPSALYAVMYHSDIPEVPLQIFISALQDYGDGAELYFIVGGGDDMAPISAFTDDVFEI